MNMSTFWMIKYMNGSVFSKVRYMNGVGFEILARTPVPKLPLSYPPPPPPRGPLCTNVGITTKCIWSPWTRLLLFVPGHSISYKIVCAPSEDTDQCTSAQSDQSLPRALVSSQGSKASSGGQRRLISVGRCAGWSESSLGAHAALYRKCLIGYHNYTCILIYIYALLRTAVLIKYEGCSKWIAYCPLARYPRGAR